MLKFKWPPPDVGGRVVGTQITNEHQMSVKSYLQWGLNLGPLVICSDAFLTELTWQVLIKGYLTLVGAPVDFWT